MNLHPDELTAARAHAHTPPFQGLSQEQWRVIIARGRALRQRFKTHPYRHCLINVAVITMLFVADFLTLIWLPRLLLPLGQPTAWEDILLGALIVGSVHSWLLYSLTVFSIHEGAAHQLIFPPRGPISRRCNHVANNLCRLTGADPIYYAENHLSHHAKFGTEEDGEFLNFVLRCRFWKTLLPFAMFANYSDFIVHRPLIPSHSVAISAIVSFGYNMIFYGYLMVERFGFPFTIVTLCLVQPHTGFFVDRLRQFTEHNLMPLTQRDGTRSFGLGLWGCLIGGGPWGQPCHWIHHLVPSIPWYYQLILHYDVKARLSPQQRQQYLLQPISGYPKLVWQLWQQTRAIIQPTDRQLRNPVHHEPE